MEKQLMLLRQCIHNSDKGLTLIELLISVVVAGIVLSLSFTVMLHNRKLYLEDQVRTNLNQNLRAALDFVGTDIKQAGERIVDPKFPIIEVTEVNGNSELVIRRRIVNSANSTNPDLPILSVCQAINSGTNNAIFTAVGSNPPHAGCSPLSNSSPNSPPGDPSLPDNIQSWRDFRCNQDGESDCQGNSQEQVQAYIYDGNGGGEFFTYTGENNITFELQKTNNNWSRNYSTNSSIYLIEERRFTLSENHLELLTIVGSKPELPININTPQQKLFDRLDTFKVQVLMQDNSTKNNFSVAASDEWQKIKSIKVSLRASKDSSEDLLTVKKNLEISGEFFPRNTLSH